MKHRMAGSALAEPRRALDQKHQLTTRAAMMRIRYKVRSFIICFKVFTGYNCE